MAWTTRCREPNTRLTNARREQYHANNRIDRASLTGREGVHMFIPRRSWSEARELIEPAEYRRQLVEIKEQYHRGAPRSSSGSGLVRPLSMPSVDGRQSRISSWPSRTV
jgi:hypothetical protein